MASSLPRLPIRVQPRAISHGIGVRLCTSPPAPVWPRQTVAPFSFAIRRSTPSSGSPVWSEVAQTSRSGALTLATSPRSVICTIEYTARRVSLGGGLMLHVVGRRHPHQHVAARRARAHEFIEIDRDRTALVPAGLEHVRALGRAQAFEGIATLSDHPRAPEEIGGPLGSQGGRAHRDVLHVDRLRERLALDGSGFDRGVRRQNSELGHKILHGDLEPTLLAQSLPEPIAELRPDDDRERLPRQQLHAEIHPRAWLAGRRR